jgi:hypothetical protein
MALLSALKNRNWFENGSVQADGGADRRRPITGGFKLLKYYSEDTY